MGVIYINEKHYLAAMPAGQGLALDLGGGVGKYREHIESLGYTYVNLDIDTTVARPHIVADAHALPFRDGIFSSIISCDSLEHMIQPWVVSSELIRCLKKDGAFVANVPFLAPFHGSDYFRFTQLGLKSLFHGCKVNITNNAQLFAFFWHIAANVFSRFRLYPIGRLVKNTCSKIDALLCGAGIRVSSYAQSYLLVVRKPE